MAEAKAEAQESSSPRCLLLLAGCLQAACQAVSAERFCLLALASRLQAAFQRNTSQVANLPPAFYIVPHAGWNYGIVSSDAVFITQNFDVG